jgi:transposase
MPSTIQGIFSAADLSSDGEVTWGTKVPEAGPDVYVVALANGPHGIGLARHGTASLIASLDVATGKVTAGAVARNDSVHFIEFLDQLEASIDPALAIHLVIDNGSSQRSKATKKWLAEHSRFVVHHTPVHASWLNQVEAFFSILTRKVLRRGEFDSRDDLVARMLAFIEHRNQTAQPFNWVYDAKKAA